MSSLPPLITTHFDIAPGIALESNDEKQPGLKAFVTKTIRTLAGIKLGRELLAEFNPGQEKWKVWADIKVPTTLLISPPNPKQAATLQALETKAGKLAKGRRVRDGFRRSSAGGLGARTPNSARESKSS